MWKEGLSWTKTHDEVTENPDGTFTKMRVQGGPFFNIKIHFYIGCRPTPTWAIGYGNEGDGKFFTRVGQWMKKKGLGNIGVALRFKNWRGE